MGQCAGTNNKRRKKQLDCYWKQPADTQNYSKQNLPKLPFQGTLGNFKIKNCVYPYLSIRAQLSGIETFFLKQKKIRNDQTAKWAFQQRFVFQKSLYQMRKSFIQIYFEDQEEKNVGQLKINLFLISTGPYHQDFSVNLKKGINTRLSFDMKLSQIIEVQLQSLEAEVDLITKHPDEKFNFSIKTIVGHNTNLEVNSRTSYEVMVMLDGNQSSSEDNQRIKKRSSSENLLPAGKNLIWSKDKSQIMPSIGMKTLVSELHHSYFQILIWKINDKLINPGLKERDISELFGQCYIALHKMFALDPSENKDSEKFVQERIIQSTEKLWHHGRAIGSGTFKFNIKNQNYIKQMQVMVRTEQGIMVYSPVVFDNQNKNKGSRCEQLVEVIKIINNIEALVSRLDEVQSMKSNFPNIESRKIKVQIQSKLQNLIDLLTKSSKQSIICYSYASELEFIKAQQIFIQLGFKMTDYLQQEDTLINQRCWEVLIVLLRRGEFLLAHMGFDQKQKLQLQSTGRSKFLESKLQAALMYQKFLNKQLQISLKSLNVRGLDVELKFAQLFFAHAYFRIPSFRNKLLEAIIKPDDPQIPQWRGIQFSLQDDDHNFNEFKQEMNAFAILCDWQFSFHKCLQKQQKSIINNSELEQILKEKNWQTRMSKRGSAFFFFVIYWVEYIEAIIVKTRDIQWKYFPGYNKIIKCFLIQMKKRSVLEYPDALKFACYKLLSNEKMLNAIVSIIIGKANLYQPLTILKAIQFISQIMSQMQKNNQKIPGTFNYYQLYKAIKIILEGDFSFAVSKTLQMLYTHFKMFHLQFRRNISMLLLGKVFFTLFLHWSHNVRDIFYHLIVMKIFRQSLSLQTNITMDMRMYQEKMNEEIRSRYHQLILILQNALSLKNQEKKHNFVHTYEKNFHRVLKKKLMDKKRRKRTIDNNMKNQKEQEILFDPPSPSSEKNGYDTLFAEKYSNNALSKVNKKIERSQSEIISNTLRVTYKIPPAEHEEVTRLRKNNNSNFKHEVYDITGGKKVPIGIKSAEIINKYEEGDFQMGKIQVEQIQYLDCSMSHYRKIKQILKKHANDKNWQVPNIKMELTLDSRESRPEKIDNW